jgi:hypothetical protein
MAVQKSPPFRALKGALLGFGARGELASRRGGLTVDRITSPAIIVTGTISAEGASVANQRDITLTVKDRKGQAIDYACVLELIVFSSSAMTDFTAVGGTTGIAAGAAGKILAAVAKKVFYGITSVTGVLSVIYTDTGADAAYLGVRLPNGEVVGIGTLTTA